MQNSHHSERVYVCGEGEPTVSFEKSLFGFSVVFSSHHKPTSVVAVYKVRSTRVSVSGNDTVVCLHHFFPRPSNLDAYFFSAQGDIIKVMCWPVRFSLGTILQRHVQLETETTQAAYEPDLPSVWDT